MFSQDLDSRGVECEKSFVHAYATFSKTQTFFHQLWTADRPKCGGTEFAIVVRRSRPLGPD